MMNHCTYTVCNYLFSELCNHIIKCIVTQENEEKCNARL